MVAELLERGVENARTTKELCSVLNISQRELTQAVQLERRAGQPICASSDRLNPGYYLAADKKEMQRFCRSLWKRAGEIHKTRRACLQTIEGLPGELTTDEKRNSNQQ